MDYSGLLKRDIPKIILSAKLPITALARKMFPGKRNSGTLCVRYEIDNSKRTLHGALLDAPDPCRCIWR